MHTPREHEERRKSRASERVYASGDFRVRARGREEKERTSSREEIETREAVRGKERVTSDREIYTHREEGARRRSGRLSKWPRAQPTPRPPPPARPPAPPPPLFLRRYSSTSSEHAAPCRAAPRGNRQAQCRPI